MAVINYDEGGGGYQAPDVTGGGFGTNDPPVQKPSVSDPNYDTVSSYYRTLLGRDPENSGVVNSWLSGTGGNLSAIQAGIANSAEGKAYAAAHANAAPAAPQNGVYDDAGTLAQIAQWAKMPGADPSLGADPNYWLGAIKSKGGLNAGNLQYWQNAGVGPTAFFNNPNRETGGTATPYLNSGTNPGGYDDPSSMLYLNQLLARLNQAQQPQDNSVLNQLNAMALARVNALNAAPYSAADEQALITKYREPLTQARDAAYQRNREQASMKGYLPSSGLLRTMDTGVNKGYEQGIAQGSNAMAVDAIQQKNANAMQQLQILSSLISANNQGFDRTSSQADHAVEIAKMFPDFDTSRLNSLLAASGDPSSASTLGSLINLGGLNLNTLNSNNATDYANSAAWGKLIASIMAGL